jgi:hypothetical protein
MSIKKLLAVGAMSGGLLASVAGVAVASTNSPAAPAGTTAVVHHASTTAAQPDPGGEASTEASGEATSQADGPGGHQDATGQNVDHQFSGTE